MPTPAKISTTDVRVRLIFILACAILILWESDSPTLRYLALLAAIFCLIAISWSLLPRPPRIRLPRL